MPIVSSTNEPTKFVVGDTVKIRTDLTAGHFYHMEHNSHYYDEFIEEMELYMGMEAKVVRFYQSDDRIVYELDIDSQMWGWTDGMFE